MNDKKIPVFICYSHTDKFWLDRLRVHLRPLSRDHDIDVWEDTRIKPGSEWRKEIRKAVENAHAAVLMISADFLASEFIHSDELPPLLKGAEEEGMLILPIIVAPSLFFRTPELALFQCVNDPSRPLLCVEKGEQEQTFVRVAEAILDSPNVRRTAVDETIIPKREAFTDYGTWTLLVKIGNWLFKETDATIIGEGMYAYLLSRQEFGEKPFVVQAHLHFSKREQHFAHSIQSMNAGIVLGWNSDKPNPRYLHIMMTGEELLVEKVGYNGREANVDSNHITPPVPLLIDTNEDYHVMIRVGLERVEVVVNDQPIQTFIRPTGIFGRVGLRPWRSQMTCKQFTVSEESGVKSPRDDRATRKKSF